MTKGSHLYNSLIKDADLSSSPASCEAGELEPSRTTTTEYDTMTEAQTATAIAEAGAKALGKASLNKRNPARKTRKGKKAKAKLTEVEKAIYMAQGRLVRKGERAVHIGPFALFHISQTSETAVTAKSPAANSAAA